MKAGWIGFPKKDKAFWETVELSAKIGYRGIEGGEILLEEGNPFENLDRFYKLGMEVLTVSTTLEELKKSVEPVIERAKRLGTNRATIWSGSAMGWWYKKPPTKAEFYNEIDIMEKAAAILAKEKIKLCYHNHDPEFQLCYDNVLAIDHIMLNSDHIWLEIDLAWANRAGADPISVINRYFNRMAAVHVKDYIAQDTIHSEGESPVSIPVFTSLGTGIMKLQPILECLYNLNQDWVIYEQDSLRNLDSLESIMLSYLYMKESGFVE